MELLMIVVVTFIIMIIILFVQAYLKAIFDYLRIFVTSITFFSDIHKSTDDPQTDCLFLKAGSFAVY
jgi:hypothetical protein